MGSVEGRWPRPGWLAPRAQDKRWSLTSASCPGLPQAWPHEKWERGVLWLLHGTCTPLPHVRAGTARGKSKEGRVRATSEHRQTNAHVRGSQGTARRMYAAPSGGFSGLRDVNAGPLLVYFCVVDCEMSIRIYILTTKCVDFVHVNHSVLQIMKMGAAGGPSKGCPSGGSQGAKLGGTAGTAASSWALGLCWEGDRRSHPPLWDHQRGTGITCVRTRSLHGPWMAPWGPSPARPRLNCCSVA